MCSERRDTSEIEITPEMIEAGLRELSNFDPDFDSGSEFVAMLYQAMFEKSPDENPQVSAYDRTPLTS